MKIQGHKACLVWPSEEQGKNPDAELVVEYPQPVEIEGSRYPQLMLISDKNHILQISRTIRFLSSTGQSGAGAPPR